MHRSGSDSEDVKRRRIRDGESDEAPSISRTRSAGVFQCGTPRAMTFQGPQINGLSPGPGVESALERTLADVVVMAENLNFERDPMSRDKVNSMCCKLLKSLSDDHRWPERLDTISKFPALLHFDVSVTRSECKIPLVSSDACSVYVHVLPQTFMSQYIERDAHTVYCCLRGLVEVTSAYVRNQFNCLLVSNITTQISEEDFVARIRESTGIKFASFDFRAQIGTNSFRSAVVTFDSFASFESFHLKMLEIGAPSWNANQPIQITCEAEVFKQLQHFGPVENCEDAHDQSVGFTPLKISEDQPPVASQKRSQITPADRVALEPSKISFVPKGSLHALRCGISSLLVSIEFGPHPLSSNAVQSHYKWSRLPIWRPHHLKTRAGNLLTSERHCQALSRHPVRQLVCSHPVVRQFFNQLHARSQKAFHSFNFILF